MDISFQNYVKWPRLQKKKGLRKLVPRFSKKWATYFYDNFGNSGPLFIFFHCLKF